MCTITGCNDGESLPAICSIEPQAMAPDLVLTPNFIQSQLETALDNAGGGCDCDADCSSEASAGIGNGTYLLTCSNDCGTNTAEGKIVYLEWLTDWDSVLNQAKKDNKPIMINFYTDVCPACRELDNKTFTDPEVVALMSEHFITVKNNAGKSSLSLDYGVFGVPTTVFAEPDGEYIGEIRGYYPPKQFIVGVEEAVKRWEDITESGDQ